MASRNQVNPPPLRTISDFKSKLTGGGARANLFEVVLTFPDAAQPAQDVLDIILDKISDANKVNMEPVISSSFDQDSKLNESFKCFQVAEDSQPDVDSGKDSINNSEDRDDDSVNDIEEDELIEDDKVEEY